MLTININDLSSNKYKAFINYAFSICDSLSFVINKENQMNNEYLEMLELTCSSDILKKESVFIHPETGTNFYDDEYMVTIRCNSYIKTSLIRVHSIEFFNGNEFPEELCFYRNNHIWFKFVSHEKLAFIVNEKSHDIDFLKSNKIRYSFSI